MAKPYKNASNLRRVFWCLLGFSSLLLLALLLSGVLSAKTTNLRTVTHHVDKDIALDEPPTDPVFELQKASSIPVHSLTAILPVTLDTLATLEANLLPFLNPSTRLRDVLVLCPESAISQARRTIRKTVAATDSLMHPDISLRPWPGEMDPSLLALRAASQVSTEYVLISDVRGLQQVDTRTQHMLLHPPALSIPVGPRGVTLSANNISCLEPTEVPQSTTYLYPPFVMPSSLALGFDPSTTLNVWESLGMHVSGPRRDGIGAIVMGYDHEDSSWCVAAQRRTSPTEDLSRFGWQRRFFNDSTPDSTTRPTHRIGSKFVSGAFAVFLPTLDDLYNFAPLVCRLQDGFHRVQTIIYAEAGEASSSKKRTLMSKQCLLTYNIASDAMLVAENGSTVASSWLADLDPPPDIIVTAREDDMLTAFLALNHRNMLSGSVLVRIPMADFPFCDWMGSLSLKEWQRWNVPQVDISIITKDRPKSLTRLLSSLSSARFFGDFLDLRVHLEQSSDAETMRIVENIQWAHGSVFAHHRIIHGGLLPAVVESWYPHSNDSYGLLLEDDVELSPLFYAWIKMSLLRYRYGSSRNRSPLLFGISLYQQKNIELLPGGRRAFNARTLFTNSDLPEPSTPYLSPIPCSWGAVYFPDHWREFHSYLSIRLSESLFKINHNVVPDVRSNRWTKSWKKYFIELVYLRGYVMLYPNFPDFISLSTNHLEVGSHVKVRTRAKQELFSLPLMQLPDIAAPPVWGLLDLPDSTLPDWNALPVLNLTGSITTLGSLGHIGHARRIELTGCTDTPRAYDISGLMCVRAP